MGLIGTKEAAKRLGVSLRRAQAMVTQGILLAKKLGRDWMIEESDLQIVIAKERKTGRPPKK